MCQDVWFGLVLDRDRSPTPTPPITAAPAPWYQRGRNLAYLTTGLETMILQVNYTLQTVLGGMGPAAHYNFRRYFAQILLVSPLNSCFLTIIYSRA